jgi:membrane protein YdbS with pleckstrin-like domain
MLCVVLFPLTPLWLLILLTQVIRAKVTTYEVRAGSVRSSYSFFSTSERDFSYDKITGVQVLENPLDRWFGTLSVELWSIGASLPIRLAHVKRADLNLPALLRQAGIPQESEPLTGIAAEYSIGTHVRSLVGLYAVTLLGVVALLTGAVVANPLFALGVLPLVVGLVALHLHATARYKRARVVFHPSHVDARDGLFWRDRTFVRYENLKKVVLTRYPFSDHGRARFLVAGERRIATNQGAPGQGQEAVIPYAFALGYLPDVRRKKTVLDGLFVERSAEAAARLSADEPCDPVEPLLESGPALGNALLQLVGISVLVFPAIALLPLTIPWTILATRRRRYQIDGDRILLSEGILYRTQSTILFERIDAIRCGQGFLGKLFKNGDVTILTAGSSKPDLVLKNCPDYQAFHAEIQRRYRAHPS